MICVDLSEIKVLYASFRSKLPFALLHYRSTRRPRIWSCWRFLVKLGYLSPAPYSALTKGETQEGKIIEFFKRTSYGVTTARAALMWCELRRIALYLMRWCESHLHNTSAPVEHTLVGSAGKLTGRSVRAAPLAAWLRTKSPRKRAKQALPPHPCLLDGKMPLFCWSLEQRRA